MAERRPVMPPVPSRPARPSRRRVLARRVVAAALFLAVVAGAVAIGLFAEHRLNRPAAPPPPPPPPKPLKIVFPEGFTIAQMAERIAVVDGIAVRRRHVRPRLSATAYLRLTRNAPFPRGFGHRRGKLEGFLFPATYDFLGGTTTRQLVADQLQAFLESWSRLNLAWARAHRLTPYEVLIVASMVEKETLAPEERRLVASVIYNRLRAGMTLGIDATIRYGLKVPGTRPLLESELNSDNPYNTRKFPGLPPTPIANPGLASMQAAAHPAPTDYLYFVRKPDRVHHFFTASAAAFAQAKCRYGYGC